MEPRQGGPVRAGEQDAWFRLQHVLVPDEPGRFAADLARREMRGQDAVGAVGPGLDAERRELRLMLRHFRLRGENPGHAFQVARQRERVGVIHNELPMSSALWRGGLGVLMSLQAIAVQGEIVIDRTRVIYPVTARTVVVNLHNEADGPRLVQAWIDDGDAMAAPENSDVPFTITPPIARMNAGTGRALRIMHDQTPKQVADR